MTTTEAAKQLWDLTYTTFERQQGDGFRTAWATKAAANEVQFRLMQAIAALRTASGDDSEQTAGAILADVLLCDAQGWMTTETSQKMQTILGELEA